MILTFDVECEIDHKGDPRGNPFHARNELVSYAYKRADDLCVFVVRDDLQYRTRLSSSFAESKLIIGFNLKYDLNVVRRHLDLLPPDGCRIWDCQVAEFIISGQKHVMPSLDECCAKYGLGQKDDRIAEYWGLGVATSDIPVDELRVYNTLDVDLTYRLYLKQQEVMTEKQKKLCILQGLDLLVLADMEWNGVKLDLELSKRKADETAEALAEVTKELRSLLNCNELVNLDSGVQLSCLLYGGSFEVTSVDHIVDKVYKSGPRKGQAYQQNSYRTDRFDFPRLFEPSRGSETKLQSRVGESVYSVYATGEDVLKQLRKPTRTHKRIIDTLLKRAELAKLLDTYYGAMPKIVEKYEWGEYLHGQYNQCVAATGRLSSSNPNMQNFSGDADELLVSRYDS